MPFSVFTGVRRTSLAIVISLLFACSDSDSESPASTAPGEVASDSESGSPEADAVANQATTDLLEKADRDAPEPGVSPTRRINRDSRNDGQPDRGNRDDNDQGDGNNQGDGQTQLSTYRTLDGTANNLNSPDMGSHHSTLARWMPAAYADGAAQMAGENRPSARLISNTVFAQTESQPNAAQASDYLWQWGQFVDHDIDLTDGTSPPEAANIAIPTGDPFFDPTGTGTATISFNRSLYLAGTGTDANNPRQQINEITSWIDGSMVYGTNDERATALRTNDGTGRLRTSDGNLLPFNDAGLANAGGDSASLFLAGDVRANEQVGLTIMHTLFVREHNRQADSIREQEPNLSGEDVYQRARQMVGALIQAVTYQEYLPALLGRNALAPYRGYQPDVDGSIANVFSTAAFRYGHSALSPSLRRIDAQGNTIAAGDLPLRNAFFSPQRITDEGGIEPILRGLASQRSQEIDAQVIDDVRNFLFGPPGSGGFDLVSLNIQRGRDHGLPSYTEVRAAMGLAPNRDFSDVSSDPEVQSRLAQVYNSVDDIDVWVGGLAEDQVNGSQVGELVSAVLSTQFAALRDGDRYWFENALPADLVDEVRNTRLSDIIRRNTTIGNELDDNVFRVR
jgi:hypothetical protein